MKPTTILLLALLSLSLTACVSDSSTNGGGGSPAPADLVVIDPMVSDNAPAAGATFTLFATVQNIGGTPTAADAALTYYQSSNDEITPGANGDTEVGTADTIASGLAVNASNPQETMVIAPNMSGTYYYGACVVLADEANMSNNCSSGVEITVPAPPLVADLVVINPMVSDNAPAAGVMFRLSATVRNMGGAPTTANTTLRFYRSDDDTFDTNDTPEGTDTNVPTLTANTSDTERSVMVTAQPAGTYYYGACVDALTDEDSSNNCSSAVKVIVPPLSADLVVINPMVSENEPNGGASVTLSATVRNAVGVAPTTAVATLTYYQSSDATIDIGDAAIMTGNPPTPDIDTIATGLAAGGESPQNIMFTAPNTAGTYYYGACVELADETETANNCSSVVELVITPIEVTMEATITLFLAAIAVTITQVGNSGAVGTSSALRLDVYSSDDETISIDGDTKVYSFTATLNAIGARTTTTYNTRYTAPVGPTSNLYYGACLVPPTGEVKTDNNCSEGVQAP